MKNKEEAQAKRSVIEESFEKYHRALCVYVSGLVGDRNVAEDIVQDVYFESWKNQDSIEFGPRFKYYLFKSAYTKSLNHLNSKANKTQKFHDRDVDSDIQRIYLQSMLSEQENELWAKQLDAMIRSAVEALPPRCRRVFVLSRSYDMKNREIAELLGISVKAVEKHISKALCELRSSLDEVAEKELA
jgi:RNA polymerase sigma-70 factor (ECF subfamily)